MMTLYAIPVALLATAVFLGPTAHAEMPAKTFQVKFTYNAQAPAEEIYSDLQRTARKAAGRFVSDRTKRRPMIVPVVMEA